MSLARHTLCPLLILAVTPLLPAQGAGPAFTPPMESPTTGDPNSPGILDPVLTKLQNRGVRVVSSHQVNATSELLNIVGTVTKKTAAGQKSLTGNTITSEESPNKGLEQAVKDLEDAAKDGRVADMRAAAQRATDILLGQTQGEIYDGFAMLNYNRGAFLPDQVAGQYKMKALRDSGLTKTGPDGLPHTIWELAVNFLWYDGESDSDTYLLRVPAAAHPFDMLRVHYTIYSTVREDFAPGVLLRDHPSGEGDSLPFKGFDSTWVPVGGGSLTTVTIDYPSLGHLRGLQTWGWRTKPWRNHFIQPVFEIVNAHTGRIELDPRGRSLAERNATLSIADVGDAAPERKIHQVAEAALSGASPGQVYAALTNPGVPPRGTWKDWIDQAERKDEIPPEAWDVLAAEGITPLSPHLGPYEMVAVFMNHELYRLIPDADPLAGKAGLHRLVAATPGELFQAKIINLDNVSHYALFEDYGPRLHFDIKECNYAPAGGHSMEIYSYKPLYGAPKAAELQWRAGWAFRPGFEVLPQYDVFPRPVDQLGLAPYFDGAGGLQAGWQYPAAWRGGDFVFDPPEDYIGSAAAPSAQRLREANGSPGLVIGQLTPGYGYAKLCDHQTHPAGEWCQVDRKAHNPYGVVNADSDGDGVNDALWFPPWLRNPHAQGGDLIPATRAWEPFLWLHPDHGSLLADPAQPSQGWWADRTYGHGLPIASGQSLNVEVMAARGLPQAIFLSDDLYRDNGVVALENRD